MRFQGFVGPSYTLQSVNVDCQRCVNLYPEMNEVGRGKEGEVASLVSTPGLSLLNRVGVGPIRGVYFSSDRVLYVVAYNKIYKLDPSFNETEIGTINTFVGNISFADNGTTLVFVDGVDGFYHVLGTGSIIEITDPDFKPADKVVFQDGYFIFNEKQSGRFYISELNSVLIDGLDFASAEGNPDNIISILSDHRDLWIFGTQTTEVFFNSGNADFPFERVNGAFIEHGCAATFSVAKMNNHVFWLSQDDKGNGLVYMARGYQPQRISTHAVEYAIRGYSDIESAVAYTYQENGHHFYVINFPSASTTWVYDMATNLWHERVSTVNGDFMRHRANYHAFAYNKHVVADYENNKLYEMNANFYTDDGDEITRQRVSPHLTSSLKRVFYSSFQLDMETGVGLDGASSVQGYDPQAMLQFSDDGGHTWSNEKWTSFGKIGRRKQRAIWRRLGYSRDRVFRVSITDPVKIAIIGAEVDVGPGEA